MLRDFWHKKSFLGIGFLTVFLLLQPCCNRKADLPTETGLESGSAGIRIVATYDPRFDKILEDYRLLSITFVNQSPQIVELDPKKDLWTLVLQDGKKETAINHLGNFDTKAWNGLPNRAQEVIEYPEVILRNTTITFDILFSKKVELKGFQRVDFFCSSLNKQFIGSSNLGESPDSLSQKTAN